MTVVAIDDRVGLDDIGSIPDLEIVASPIVVETWAEFVDKASEDVPMLIDKLWPESSFGFIASPPKKGKTWVALSLAVSLATGQKYLSRFNVPEPRPVIYLALEGHRAALRARLAAVARGMGLNPLQDSHDLDLLKLVYKPRDINIATPQWAQHIMDAALEHDAALVIVDVLRAAARIKENEQSEFSALRANLSPLLDSGVSIAMLHHFTKKTEASKERDAAERMSGSGAMYGALDAGIFITGSENGARKLRIEFDMRDIATPNTIGVRLEGEGKGPNGGFTHHDKAWWIVAEAPDEDDVQAPAEEILTWLKKHDGEGAEDEIALAFDVSTKTIFRRRKRLEELGVELVAKRGTKARYRIKGRTTDTKDMSDPLPMSDLFGENTGIDEQIGHKGQMAVSNPENPLFAGENEVGQVGLPTGEDGPCPTPSTEETPNLVYDPSDDIPF